MTRCTHWVVQFSMLFLLNSHISVAVKFAPRNTCFHLPTSGLSEPHEVRKKILSNINFFTCTSRFGGADEFNPISLIDLTYRVHLRTPPVLGFDHSLSLLRHKTFDNGREKRKVALSRAPVFVVPNSETNLKLICHFNPLSKKSGRFPQDPLENGLESVLY